jgi:hypothetical protein
MMAGYCRNMYKPVYRIKEWYNQCVLLVISTTYVHLWHLAQFFFEWEMFPIKVVEDKKRHILCSITFFENCAVYEIMWKNMVEPEMTQMTIEHGICFEFWINTAVHLHGKRIANRTGLNLTFVSTLPPLFPHCIHFWNSPTAFITAMRVTFLAHLILPDLLVLTICGPHGGDHKLYRNTALSATSLPTFRRNMCTRSLKLKKVFRCQQWRWWN